MIWRIAAVLLAALVLAPPAGATDFDGGAVTIPDGPGPGSPYPSTIEVSGLHRPIAKVTVRLNVTHPASDEIDAWLVGPRGQSVMLMSDVGSTAGVSGVSLRFDDDAAAELPYPLVSGTYKPTNLDDGDPGEFVATATLTNLKGTDPNGTWRLFVADDTEFDGGRINSWRISITDGPGAPVAWGASAYSVVESAGSAALTLTRPSSALDGTVSYSTRDTSSAQAGAHYTATSGTVTFAPGETSKTINIPIADDPTDENDRAFKVHIDLATGDAVRTLATDATVTIVDDDPPPVLSVADATIPEAGAGAFVLTLSGPSQLAVTAVLMHTAGTGRWTVDYHFGDASIAIPAGTTSLSVPARGEDDAYDEPDEIFTATLTRVVNATVGRGLATGRIVDDDQAEPPAISGVRIRHHRLEFGVRTNFDGTFVARARIGALRLKSAKTAIRAAHTVKLALALPKAARRRTVQLTVTATGPSGTITARRTLK